MERTREAEEVPPGGARDDNARDAPRTPATAAHAAPPALSEEEAASAYMAALLAPLRPRASGGRDGVAELVAFVNALPRRKHVTVYEPTRAEPAVFCIAARVAAPAQLARTMRAGLRDCAAAMPHFLALRAGASPADLPPAFVAVTLRHFGSGDAEQQRQERRHGARSATASQQPRAAAHTPTEVYGFAVRADGCVRLPRHMNEEAQSVDADTGERWGAEEGVLYM
jgi:hypothetical protein